MIPYGHQEIVQADIDAVVAVLRSDFLTQGPVIACFEEAVAATVGGTHAVAVNSATSALHVACMALGLGAGDRLWTVPNTFVASANCARYCGAAIDFVDTDARTWNMSVAALAEKLRDAQVQGTLPKVVVPVHFGGQPTEQEAIFDLAQRYGFKVLEDASHSIGATRGGEPVGSGRWSDITVFSFHPVKIITSGEGGMALTRDPKLAQQMRLARSHGITRDPAAFVNWRGSPGEQPPTWYYEQQQLGLNYRMTDIHAALGLSQLARLHDHVARRNELAERYRVALAGLALQLPCVQPQNYSAFHLYVVRVLEDCHHRQVFEFLRAAGIGVNVHYTPVHLQPYYRALGFGAGQFPQAEAYARQAITLPLYPGLTVSAQDRVIDCMQRALAGAR
jgi:UDP-4-amino-4,6-dideoxy-N-acetyl-beta-L-altrosamine transaminase